MQKRIRVRSIFGWANHSPICSSATDIEVNAIIFILTFPSCSVLRAHRTVFLWCLYAPGAYIDIGNVLTFFNLSWSELHLWIQHTVIKIGLPFSLSSASCIFLYVRIIIIIIRIWVECLPQVHCVKRASNNFWVGNSILWSYCDLYAASRLLNHWIQTSQKYFVEGTQYMTEEKETYELYWYCICVWFSRTLL